MTAHDTRLAHAAEQHDADRTPADRDAPAGAPVKYSACYCDDRAHGYPDRCGWVTTEQLADDDLGATNPRGGHVVVRVTDTVENLRARIVDALVGDDWPFVGAALREAMYGGTADVILERLTTGPRR